MTHAADTAPRAAPQHAKKPRRVAVLVRLPETLKCELRAVVASSRVPQSEIVRRAIVAYLRRYGTHGHPRTAHDETTGNDEADA